MEEFSRMIICLGGEAMRAFGRREFKELNKIIRKSLKLEKMKPYRGLARRLLKEEDDARKMQEEIHKQAVRNLHKKTTRGGSDDDDDDYDEESKAILNNLPKDLKVSAKRTIKRMRKLNKGEVPSDDDDTSDDGSDGFHLTIIKRKT